MNAKPSQNRFYLDIYRLVRQIPAGKVATYGQIADLLGKSGCARQVGYALFRVSPDMDVPWQRVVNSKGKISASPMRRGSDYLQRILLEQEGIEFDNRDSRSDPFGNRINLKQYQWHPEQS